MWDPRAKAWAFDLVETDLILKGRMSQRVGAILYKIQLWSQCGLWIV